MKQYYTEENTIPKCSDSSSHNWYVEYEGVKFYVVEGDLVKVKLDGTPEWWNNNYNGLIL